MTMANAEGKLTPEERDRVIAREMSAHPLEMFPFFRRWPRGPLRDILYTLIWNTGFMALFVLIGITASFRAPSPRAVWSAFVISQCIGFTLHCLFALGGRTVERRLRRQGRTTITAYYVAVSTFGVIAGFWIASTLLGYQFLARFQDPRWLVAIAVTSVVISLVLAVIFFWREKSALSEAALERAQRRAADIKREALAANLRALQAQIEPHFLFNTLANVTSLIESEPVRARRMLESFIRFLRASLAATRRQATTLGEEFALVGDYLEVLQVRMGDRLRVAIDLPAELAALEIPSMLVQPVVENAIRHGLEPKVEGGRIELRARSDEGRLALEVADTGIGFAPGAPGGIGLANIRERLRLAYGEAARLGVRENTPTGTIVTIALPLPKP